MEYNGSKVGTLPKKKVRNICLISLKQLSVKKKNEISYEEISFTNEY